MPHVPAVFLLRHGKTSIFSYCCNADGPQTVQGSIFGILFAIPRTHIAVERFESVKRSLSKVKLILGQMLFAERESF